jgi:hypothetical protein
MHLVANKESQMRQMELDLGPEEAEEAKRAAVKLDRQTHEEVVALVAEAIVALIENARAKEVDDEPSVEP